MKIASGPTQGQSLTSASRFRSARLGSQRPMFQIARPRRCRLGEKQRRFKLQTCNAVRRNRKRREVLAVTGPKGKVEATLKPDELR
jgi:hypothetical protein